MYYVFKCNSCNKHWGSKGRSKKCPHCGTIVPSSQEVKASIENASHLQRAVSMANLPENIRSQVMDKEILIEEEVVKSSPKKLFFAIQKTSSNGKFSKSELELTLKDENISIPVDDVIAEAIAQGLLFKCDEENFVLLQ